MPVQETKVLVLIFLEHMQRCGLEELPCPIIQKRGTVHQVEHAQSYVSLSKEGLVWSMLSKPAQGDLSHLNVQYRGNTGHLYRAGELTITEIMWNIWVPPLHHAFIVTNCLFLSMRFSTHLVELSGLNTDYKNTAVCVYVTALEIVNSGPVQKP